MTPSRRWRATRSVAGIALTSLALVVSRHGWAEDVPGTSEPEAAAADPRPSVPDPVADSNESAAASTHVNPHRAVRHLTIAQSIDENVRRLARALDLDSEQQASLRQILVDQHRRITKLRGMTSSAQGDLNGMMLAVYDQTKARIRALLTDEQRQKYSVDVPRGDLAPAQADLRHWLDLQESKRRQDLTEGDAK